MGEIVYANVDKMMANDDFRPISLTSDNKNGTLPMEEKSRIYRKKCLLQRLSDGDGHSHGGPDHGVVALVCINNYIYFSVFCSILLAEFRHFLKVAIVSNDR